MEFINKYENDISNLENNYKVNNSEEKINNNFNTSSKYIAHTHNDLIIDNNNSISDNIYFENENDIIFNKGKFLCSERYNVYSNLVKKVKEKSKTSISKYIFYYNTINNIKIYIYTIVYSTLILILIKKLIYK